MIKRSLAALLMVAVLFGLTSSSAWAEGPAHTQPESGEYTRQDESPGVFSLISRLMPGVISANLEIHASPITMRPKVPHAWPCEEYQQD